MIGILFSLAAAFSWGCGDFCGGLAARRMHPFQVLLLTTTSSLGLIALFALARGESLPSLTDAAFAVAAGVSGALGLAALYRGLSVGSSAVVAPVAGVVGAIVPTLAGLWIEGLPGPVTLLGFGLSLAGIWLVTRSGGEGAGKGQAGLGLALLAGTGFGGFLALIAQIEGEGIFMPLVLAKLASLLLASLLTRMGRLPLPRADQAPLAILSGFLDSGGNILYLYATQFARLDIAALLSSLYPAGTVFLSSLVLKEKVTRGQMTGAGACLLAILLITAG
jgi:drug/metabolite transporter (DMT)-like permease